MKSYLFPFILLVTSLFSACNENCFDESYRTQYLFHLELIDVNTGHNLFLGNNALYPLDSFQLYRMKADTLSTYRYYSFAEEPFFVISCRDTDDFTPDIDRGEVIDTFYFQVPDSDLNMLTFEFNEVMTDCFEDFVENYDVSLNGNLICERCTSNDEIVILQD